MKTKKTYYISTPIYYPSGKWHLGHSYTTVICDALARYKRMQGFDVMYLTGTDEHGQKIEKRAQESNVTPKQFVDKLTEEIVELWKLMNISYDRFIRTTDDYHVAAVQRIFKKLYDNGDIYKGAYEGKYCTPCETFWTDAQLKEGKCPDCGREVVTAKEEAYFFRLSKYADRVADLLQNTSYLRPVSRVSEMVNNFIKPGLDDLCVSRTSFKWGIPVDFDPDHVVYVWIDALSNYITALGAFSDDDTLYRKYWPCDVHMVGKEIVRFHSIIWPALLMALDLPVPKAMYGHGWLMLNGDKMSKSKMGAGGGNVTDPFVLCKRYGVDAIRYFLLREVPFGSDGMYNNETLLSRINTDLVNDLGNLVSRTTAMVTQYFDGVVPKPDKTGEHDESLIELASGLAAAVDNEIEGLRVSRALEEIFKLIARANKYIDETAPWKLVKEDKERLATVMFNLTESIRIATVMLSPFLPDTAVRIFEAIGCLGKQRTPASLARFGAVAGNKVTKGAHLFARLDIKKELAELEAIAAKEEKKPMTTDNKPNNKPEITIDDFAKLDLRTAVISACENIANSDKLYKLTVHCGEEIRTVVSGIAKHYTADQLVGKQVILVANLKPVKLRGVESSGMILCADDGERVIIVSPEAEMPDGSTVR